jgi:SAM-dependent methyltransferase
MTTQATRINVGCGQTATNGWKNYDNSPSVRLVRQPMLAGFLRAINAIDANQRAFMESAKAQGIHWADAVKRIPEPDASVDVLYSSHMLEHLDQTEARRFLIEAKRVLRPGGILRLAVPDLKYHVKGYLDHQAAEQFMEGLHVCRPRPTTLRGRIRSALLGDRHHLWMYDGPSLCRFLTQAGFLNPIILEPGKTTIADPGPLDLSERAPESVFVECTKPDVPA